MGKAVAFVSCCKNNLFSVRHLSVLFGPPHNRCFNVTKLVVLSSVWSLPSETDASYWRMGRGCGSCILYLGAWGDFPSPMAGSAHPNPYALIPTSGESGHVSTTRAMSCSSVFTSRSCHGVGLWHVPWRTSTSHSDCKWAFQMRVLK